MLADASAGLGVDMSRLVLAYGQIRSASFLRGQEVRQLTEAGIPILEELRKQFEAMNGVAISAGDVFDKISARQVPFEMVAKVFKDMTSEGGKFYHMQEIQADTLKGKLSNLVDAYQIMFSEIGENQEGFLKGSVDAVRSMIENYQKLGHIITPVIVSFGAFKGMMLTLNAIKWVTDVQVMTNTLRAAGMQANFFSTALKKMGVNMGSLAIGGTVAAVALVTSAIVQASKAAHELENSLHKIGQTKLVEAEKSVKTFEELIRSMEGMTQGSQEYREAIERLNRQYGDYLPNLLTEKTTLAEIKEMSDAVVQSIYNRSKAYAYEQGVQEMNEKYVKDQTKYIKNITKWLGDLGVSEDKASAAISRFRQEILKSGDSDLAFSKFVETMENFFPGKQLVGLGEMAAQGRYLGKSFIEADQAARSFSRTLDGIFGTTTSYSTSAEFDAVNAINQDYEDAKNRLKEQKLDADQYDAEVKRLEISRVSDLISYYEELGEKDESRLDMVKKYKNELASLTKTATGWQAKVQEVLTKNGLGQSSAGNLWATDTDSLVEYWDTLRKVYKQVSLTDSEMESLKQNNESLYKTYVKQKKAIEEVGKALGVSIDDKIKKKKGKSPEQIELEAQIETVKKLMSAYEQMKKMGIGDETAKRWFAALAPGNEEITNTLRFREALQGYADTLRDVYGDVNGAAAIESLLGTDNIKEAMDAYSKLESLRGKLQSWIAEDFNIAGKGIAFDINKLAAELNSKNNAVDNRLNDLKVEFQEATKNEAAIAAIREKYGDEAWAKYLDSGENALEELADKEKQYNSDVMMEKVRDLAKNYVKEWGGLEAFDLSNWGDKTIMELNAIKEAVDNFDVNQLPEELVTALLGEDGKNWERLNEFTEAFRKALDAVGKKTSQQIKEETIKRVKKAAQAFGELADSVKGIADAYGNEDMANALSSMKEFSIAERQELKRTFAEAREEARKLSLDLSLSDGVDTIFGDNSLRSMRNAVNLMKEYGKAVEEEKQKTNVFFKKWNNGMLSLSKNQRKLDLKEAAEDLGYQLIDANGALNSNALQAILDTYKDLDNESRAWLEKAIEDTDAYTKAMEQLRSEVKNVFGQLADDMADTLINEYMEIGDATVDLAENMDVIFSDLAQSIAKNLVSAFILDNVLDKYENDVMSFYEQLGEGNLSEEQIASYFSALAEGIKNDTETAVEYTNRLMDALKAQGIELSKEETGGGMSNGIKSITEDTANLLASYINAIRADVAANRVSLTDIQTNTFRSAIAAEGILSKLSSMMGSFSGGGDGLKTGIYAEDTAQKWGMIAKSNPYPALPNPKKVYSNDWKDEHGKEEYTEQMFYDSYDFEVSFYVKAFADGAIPATAVLRNQIQSFFNAIRQGTFRIYDSYTAIGRRNVRYLGYTEDSFRARGNWARAIFKVKFRVDDPITLLSFNPDIEKILPVFTGTSTSSGSGSAKTVAISNFVLEKNAGVCVKFANKNTATAPTLNVTATGVYPINNIPNEGLRGGIFYLFEFDGSAWNCLGIL
ncbi:unnamed protein product [Cylicocyclus nassatus]|uniref:Tail tape measure protein n=1 Tax=Cylicocyclus nassatus TaxID=53992 RepID=A0AA36GYW1_CYLNA|nr:unnamed protein product [Cylicocyclus nassatus]